MATNDKTRSAHLTSRDRQNSADSTTSSVLRTPRTPRFAEATAVNSPVDPPETPRFPTNHYKPEPQPADVGFGYLSAGDAQRQVPAVEMEETDRNYMPPQPPTPGPTSPLKSAMKSPGQAPRNISNVLSPTFREEQMLEKREEATEKEQAKDLKVKTRVRVAKMFLRGVNFSCSLIVLSMLAATFSIFNATKSLPPRSGLPPWASTTNPWAQIVLIVIASISLFMSIIIMGAYFRGGHKRAEKVAVYYTTFAVIFFIFSIVMWAIGAGILNQSKATGGGQDLWGWSCKDNRRRQLFEDDVHYALVCRLQNWSLVCCIIEVVIEVITIAIYGVVFYRFYSKRRLRKSMQIRDRARSDMYLAQLRSQSAPNTPGGPLSPRDGGWRPPPGHPEYKGQQVNDPYYAAPMAEEGEAEGVQYARAGFTAPKPFALQPPPIKVQGATPRMQQEGWEPMSSPTAPAPSENVQDHVPAAPGETQYAAVPIPGAYAPPVASPGIQPATPRGPGFDFRQ